MQSQGVKRVKGEPKAKRPHGESFVMGAAYHEHDPAVELQMGSFLNQRSHNPSRRCETAKDLGILIDSRRTFSEHIDQVVNKAYAALFALFRCTQITD
ncbi:hypothetical protein OSTOST_04449, partial [Ostertagia ostertagi]